MKKIVIVFCTLLVSLAFSDKTGTWLFGAVARNHGIVAASRLLCQSEIRSYEGGLTVVTGTAYNGTHIQIAERGGTVTVGSPYIREGY